MRPRELLGSIGFLALSLLYGACGPELDLGSDLIWSARHEQNNFDEWTALAAGNAFVSPATNSIATSTERAHRGSYGVKMSITTDAIGAQSNAGLSRKGTALPTEAYYSSWYYLPRSVNVGTFWVIFKLRTRDSADDASTEHELFDLDLKTTSTGEMSLRLYDHRSGDIPLDDPNPVVPVGRWFHVEAFYRNANDNTGRVTFWLDDRLLVDVRDKPTGRSTWIHWIVASVAEDLTPADEILFVDDAAISRARVGTTGILSR